MWIEVRDLPTSGQRVTFKPDAEEDWKVFSAKVGKIIRESGIEDPLSVITSLNAQTTDKYHITIQIPNKIFEFHTKKGV